MWDEDAGGFVFTADCAIEAGNWAVELRAQDPDANLTVLGVCPEHSEQPATTCADCAAEYDET
ncbi:hypothetical protein [Streptomyces sp. NPDC097619]|uniref:hypothetical protein n=1 Tax=Streptomyces sp. NPDC097619 TaxID=3157228 RepID=UPI00332FAA93